MRRALTEEAKSKRRQNVLDAALDEFVERGFTAARMDDIAQRAGLSKGALYLYFNSKKALYRALIQAIAIPNVARIERIITDAPSARAALDQLMAFAPTLIRHTPLPRVLKVLCSDGGDFPDVVRQYRQEVVERGLAALTELLRRGQQSGEFDIEAPELTARLIIAPFIMSALWHIVFERDPEARVDLEALFKQHERLLLKAISADGGET